MKRKRKTQPNPARATPTHKVPPADAAAEIERLRQENEHLQKQVADQAREIKDLKRQLALRQQNSTITSKQPSSDGLAG